MFRSSISVKYCVLCKDMNKNGVKQHNIMICDLRNTDLFLPRTQICIANHVSTPRWFMSVFLLKSDGGTPQSIFFNVFIILKCSINREINLWHIKSWCFTPGSGGCWGTLYKQNARFRRGRHASSGNAQFVRCLERIVLFPVRKQTTWMISPCVNLYILTI